jgi:glycine/D-amino acid oxidase-like deaminating enzyme
MPHRTEAPARTSYDVVIIGGAIMGASTAWFLSDDPAFTGSVLVIERDLSFETASTAHTNSSIRQQFSTPLNVQISQFGADYVRNMQSHMGDDPRIPAPFFRSFGYMYLADNEPFAETLRANAAVQRAHGAETELLTPDEIAARYPFYALDDIVLGSINLKGEGHFDGALMDQWWRRQSRERGVEWIENEVVEITTSDARVESVTLKSGEVIACGHVVNATGPRAARTAAMAGIDIPVEPRKRFSWIFKAAQPLDRALPLTIDPSGVHVRENGGGTYQAGSDPHPDPAVAPDDFAMDHALWQDHVWPVIATRIPQFEAVKVTAEWAGHYAMNTFDHNAILGPHDRLENFLFLNGFSGHGLQQSPAMGRGTAEWLTDGAYRTLDLTPFHFARLAENRPLLETAVI